MPKPKNKDLEKIKKTVTELKDKSILSHLESQLVSLREEIKELKTSLKIPGVKQLKFEFGEFDIRDIEGRLDDKYEWDYYAETFDIRYFIPITLKEFSKLPKIFLSINAFYKVDGIWVYPDNITSKGFDIIIESNEDLDSTYIGWERELVISWLALGY